MGMTVRTLPALGPQAEGGGSGPAKQDAACGVMVTTESVIIINAV